MVVDQAGCLHVRVHDCGADELEAALACRSLLSASDSGEVAGISWIVAGRCWIGLPSTNDQIYASNEPHSR